MQSAARAVLAALLLSATPAPAAAAPPIPGAQQQVLAFGARPKGERLSARSERISLPPVTSAELLAMVTPDRRSSQVRATLSGRTLTVDAALSPPPLNAVVRRELRGIWQFAPRQDVRDSMSVPQVRMELRSAAGERGALSLHDDPDRQVFVQLGQSQSAEHDADGAVWFEGSAWIEIPIAALQAAGTYSGRLEFFVETP
jgi:hypothetical protein